jgi:hypothetical protein
VLGSHPAPPAPDGNLSGNVLIARPTYTDLATEENVVADAERQVQDRPAHRCRGACLAMGLNGVAEAP